jgi:ferredoxin
MSSESFAIRLPENAPGKFYVTIDCLDCDLCRETAPTVFGRIDAKGSSYIERQPATGEDLKPVREAIDGCPCEAIFDDGDRFDWSEPPVADETGQGKKTCSHCDSKRTRNDAAPPVQETRISFFARIRGALSGRRKSLTGIESLVLKSTRELLDPRYSGIWDSQVASISKIQRLIHGQEVDFYRDEQTVAAIPVLADREEMVVARFLLIDRSSGHQTKASVCLVRGVLFSIEFSAPPGDVDFLKATVECLQFFDAIGQGMNDGGGI